MRWTLPALPLLLALAVHRPVYAGGIEAHIGDYPAGKEVQSFESLPGARKVLYINLEAIMQDGSLTLYEPPDIWRIWQSVASGLSMFEINVTTSPEVFEAAAVEDSGHLYLTPFTPNNPSKGDIFGTDGIMLMSVQGQPDAYDTGRMALHYVGDLFGLSNDGTSKTANFGGFAEFAWVPALGNPFFGDQWGDNALYQWSKGEYTDASNQEDDLAILASKLPYRDDDHPGQSPLVMWGERFRPEDNRGQISPAADQDEFSFEVLDEARRVSLRIDRTEYLAGAMLDVEAEILDEHGASVARHNASAARHASFDLVLDPGSYTLVVRGGSEGTPKQGFSNYSSMGFYAIEGAIEGQSGEDTETETSSGSDGGTGTGTEEESTGASSDGTDEDSSATETTGDPDEGESTSPNGTDGATDDDQDDADETTDTNGQNADPSESTASGSVDEDSEAAQDHGHGCQLLPKGSSTADGFGLVLRALAGLA